MSQAGTPMRRLAERLIAQEARQDKSAGTQAAVTFPVPEKLRVPLAALVGNTGFSALLARALVLASQEVAWLRAVHIRADGALEVPVGLEAQVGPVKVIAGRVALLARLLELLEALIGANLTLRLLREVWPKLVLDELTFAGGERDESKT
jgi:hypothetical protein